MKNYNDCCAEQIPEKTLRVSLIELLSIESILSLSLRKEFQELWRGYVYDKKLNKGHNCTLSNTSLMYRK